MDDKYSFPRVLDLFIPSTQRWNLPYKFGLSIDVIIWNLSRDGVYYVKIGYAVATNSLTSNEHLRVIDSWHKLWNC